MRSSDELRVASPDLRLGAARSGGASPAPSHVAAIRSKERSIPVRVVLLALRFYKANLSILFAGSCRFEPTCSRYAYEAIERFGVTRGVWLGMKRLLRCHPLSRKFGYDPVPENWRETAPVEEMTSNDARSTAAIPNEVHS